MRSIQEVLEKLTLTDAERNLLAGGYCPKCKVSIRGRFDPIGKAYCFAPEICATLREHNIDIYSGHYNNCELKGLRLP